jgi:hypothetical protein
MVPVHFVAVLLAAVVAFIIGFLAHGPVAGKLWIKLANIHPTGNEKFSDMIPQMIANLFVNIVCAYVLAVVYAFASTSPYMGMTGAWSGVVSAIWIWLGFNLTATSIDMIWMGKSKKLWLFEAVSSLVVFVAMGAIIGAWH